MPPRGQAVDAHPWGHVDRWVACVVTLLGFVAGGVNIGGTAYANDEGTYTMQAHAVYEWALSPYWYWYDHPPLAWIQMAPVMWVADLVGFGDDVMTEARFAPLLAMAISTGLLYGVARRMDLHRVVGLAAVLVFLTSPLVIEGLRKVYIDNIALPWVLGAFLLALNHRRYLWNCVLAGACLAVAALSKETTLVMVVPLLVVVLERAARGVRLKAVGSTLAPMALIGAMYPFTALLHGQIGNLVQTLSWQLRGREGSGSVLDEGTRGNAVVVSWLQQDSCLLVAGVVCAAVLLAVPWKRFLGVAVLFPLLVAARPSGFLPGMFVNMLTPFLALSIVVVASVLVGSLARRTGRRVAGTSLAVVVATAGVVAAPTAVERLAPLYQVDETTNQRAAVAWMLANTPEESTVLVDDSSWVQMVDGGRTDVWTQSLFVYKLDTDPTALRHLPNGWRDVDYVLATPTIRGDLEWEGLVQGREALRNSETVHHVGSGPTSVEILRVLP